MATMIEMRPSFTQRLFLAFLAIATSSANTFIPFQYSEQALESCVRHFEKHGDSTMIEGSGNSTNKNACRSLYDEFLDHFYPDISSHEMLSSPNYVCFVKTARLVHQHNARHHDGGFKLRLNQFADTSLPYSKRDQADIREAKDERDDAKTNEDGHRTSKSWQTDLEGFWENHKKDTDIDFSEDSDRLRARKLRWKETDVHLLDSPSSIMVTMEHQDKRQRRQFQEDGHQQQKQRQENHRRLFWEIQHDDASPLSSLLRVEKSSDYRTKVRMSGDGAEIPTAFSSPQVPPSIRGTEVELHKDTVIESGVAKGIRVGSPDHTFTKSLDWSTSHNPDGVPLVHRGFDQGSCGSCWAVAATGSLEASAARNTARDYFVAELARIAKEFKAIDQEHNYHNAEDDEFDNDGYDTMVKDLTENARTIASDTFQELNLSVQELLDCGTSSEEGCMGGSPHLAFPYIHKHGLVRSEEYPYVGYGDPTNIKPEHKSTCRKEKRLNPIATVESWGLLHRNHEELIEYALLHVGPVAVGINGATMAFRHYGGGIFDSDNCDQNANHALLIVGYGQEKITKRDGESRVVRYWIARNSWGESWGENGFVRVKRGSGEKGVPGVCGIARSPSVALGGVYRLNRTDPITNVDPSITTTARYRKNKYVTSYDTYASPDSSMENNHPICDSMISTKRFHLHYGCMQFSDLYRNHQPMLLALISLICALLAMLPLVASLRRQHPVSLGNRSIILEHFGDDDQRTVATSKRPRSVSGTLSERTHLLSLNEIHSDVHESKPKTKRPRGRSIVMTSPEHDPFHLVPSATFDDSEEKNVLLDSSKQQIP